MEQRPDSRDGSSATTVSTIHDVPPDRSDRRSGWLAVAGFVACGVVFLCGNGAALLLLVWLFLIVRALMPGTGGDVAAATALVLGVLVLVTGPWGQLGVVDLHTFLRHPYAQPGKFLVWLAGGVLLLRAWMRIGPALARRGLPTVTAQVLAGVILILAGGAWVLVSQAEDVDAVVTRLNQNGRVTQEGLERLMRAVAGHYEDWGHAEGEMDWKYRFGPALCRGPGGPTARISASQDQTTHGRKLYTVYAKERDTYMLLNWANWKIARNEPVERRDVGGDPAAGQAIVKESFVPVPDGPGHSSYGWRMRAEQDGILYHPGARGDLFIMVQLDPRVQGTDNGWVYGTVTPDGRRVTSAGLVGNCMGCHADAPHGRLFGLPAED